MPNESKTDPRIGQLEADVAQRDKTIEDLQAQISALNSEIANLKQSPGDTSRQIVDDEGSRNEESPLEEYYRRANAAKAMFNALP